MTPMAGAGPLQNVKVAFLARLWLGTDHSSSPSTFTAVRHLVLSWGRPWVPAGPFWTLEYALWLGDAPLLPYLIPLVLLNLTLAFQKQQYPWVLLRGMGRLVGHGNSS